VPVAPEILARLEALAARAPERTLCGVDALVEAHRGRVLEAFAADAALARVLVTVSVEIVLL